MQQQSITAYRSATGALLTTLNSFTNETVNTKPSSNAWSAAQITDHLLKSQSDFARMMQSGTKTKTERNPEENKQKIEAIFLDYNNKMQSPKEIIPANDPFDKATIIESFSKSAEENINAAAANDISQTFAEYEFPGMGHFTGAEWLWFLTYHTQRHTHQMQQVLQTVSQ